VSGTNDTSSIKNPSHTYNSSGSYKVDLLATSSTGCKSSVTSNTFNVDFAPTVDFVITSNGCSNSPVSFAANPVGLTQYNWNYGDINSGVNNTATGVISTHNFTSGGNFSITLNTLTNSGCNSSKNKTLSLIAPLNSVIVTTNNITANSVTFNWNAVAGATSYQVSVNGSSYIIPSSGATGLSHLINGLTAGQTVTIIVKAIATVDCANSTGNASAKTISPFVDIFIPNTFTPNGDGKNDVLLVYGNNIMTIEMLIFNQWGNKIFEIRNQSEGWNGKHYGKNQPVGVYIYAAKITTTSGEIITKKGSINLIR
jgi:gliding motility-associated-like protein